MSKRFPKPTDQLCVPTLPCSERLCPRSCDAILVASPLLSSTYLLPCSNGVTMRYRTFGSHRLVCLGDWLWRLGYRRQLGPAVLQQDSLDALHKAMDLGCEFHRHRCRLWRWQERTPDRPGAAQPARESLGCHQDAAICPAIGRPSPYDLAEDRYPAAYLRANVKNGCAICRRTVWTCCSCTPGRAPGTGTPAISTFFASCKLRAKFVPSASTPEQDQNSVIDLMRNGHIDTVQVIYNIFEQEPAAELLPLRRTRRGHPRPRGLRRRRAGRRVHGRYNFAGRRFPRNYLPATAWRAPCKARTYQSRPGRYGFDHAAGSVQFAWRTQP